MKSKPCTTCGTTELDTRIDGKCSPCWHEARRPEGADEVQAMIDRMRKRIARNLNQGRGVTLSKDETVIAKLALDKMYG